MATATEVIGHVVQVAGPAIDCQFPEGQIPEVYTAIRITSEGFDVPTPIDIVCETEQHIGEGRIRTIAMQPTEGLVRGMKAISLGGPISVPVGKQTLGRVLNVLGEPVDNMGPVNTEKRYRNVRDRYQSRGSAGALSARRQDRSVRRRGSRQNGRHHGAHQ
jgi:F-type H+-transporting ATPase subunit beta